LTPERRLILALRWMPLVSRELREQSRRSGNYWLRVMGVLVLLGATGYFALGGGTGRGFGVRMVPVRAPNGMIYYQARQWMETGEVQGLEWIGRMMQAFEGQGSLLFEGMNLVLLVAIWVLGPLLTADVLSRERREGTLGLLFLTPTRAVDIVIAKLVVHGYRAGLVLVGVLPVLMLPVLLGGVSWPDVLRAAILDSGALLLALAAGLWASTRWQGSRAVMLGALALAFLSAVVWLGIWGWMKGMRAWMGGDEADVLGSVAHQVGYGWGMLSRVLFEPKWLLAQMAGRRATLVGQLGWYVGVWGVAIGIAVLVIRRAAARVVEVQREAVRPGRVARMEAALSKPIRGARFLGRFRGWILRRVPHVWPELRTWKLRVAPWLVLLAVGTVEVRSASDLGRIGVEWGRYPWGLLILFGAVSGAAAFQRDRVSGVLELVLTAPYGERMLILGKWTGLMIQVGPALLLVLVCEMSMARVQGMEPTYYLRYFFPRMGGQILVALAAGAYFSLRFRTYVPALLAAIGVVVISSVVTSAIASGIAGVDAAQYRHWVAIPAAGRLSGLFMAGIAAGMVGKLYLDLRRRERIAS